MFELRCKLTKVKMNMKGMYNQFECKICEKEEQSHIQLYKCDKIQEIRKQENMI